jgi:acyl-CoA synthetase (AMP-forming)/AMP-acid ligase II
MNIVEPILFQCKLSPLAAAICVPGSQIGTVNYGQLGHFIYNVARNALKSGIAPGDIVATYVSDPILHTSLILGLMHVGAVSMSLREPKGVSGISPSLILTDAPARFSGVGTVLGLDHSWIDGDGRPTEQLQKPVGGDDDLCRIILTSGSTGVSKGIAFTHRLLAERIASYAYSKGPRVARCSRLFCDLGISSSPGFRYAMAMLGRGGTVYFLGEDPIDILQTIDLHKIEGMATSPYGLGEFLKFFEADTGFDVSFEFIVCQGAMLSRQLSARARARMCQNLYSTYGATELATVAVGHASALESVSGAVGYVQPGVLVEAIDKSGNILPPLRDGSLRIRTPNMASGYYGDPESSRTYFRDGYFYSGDIGHTTPDGLLVITGREKTALNAGGDTVSPELVEAVITSFANVDEAGVFALNNDLGIAEINALIVARAPVDLAALRSHCARQLAPSCVPVRFHTVDTLPRGGQGKLERHRLPDWAAARGKQT